MRLKVIHGVSCRRLYIGGIFPVYYGFLPVICSWSFVHLSIMFIVVDVLRADSYTVAEYEWIFRLCYE